MTGDVSPAGCDSAGVMFGIRATVDSLAAKITNMVIMPTQISYIHCESKKTVPLLFLL